MSSWPRSTRVPCRFWMATLFDFLVNQNACLGVSTELSARRYATNTLYYILFFSILHIFPPNCPTFDETSKLLGEHQTNKYKTITRRKEKMATVHTSTLAPRQNIQKKKITRKNQSSNVQRSIFIPFHPLRTFMIPLQLVPVRQLARKADKLISR